MKLQIKTSLSQREEKALREIVRRKKVLEVGALMGYSTVTMAQVASHVTSIDPHKGYPYYNPRPTLPTLIYNLNRYEVAQKVTPIVDKAQNILIDFKQSFDVAFIDCTGEYEDTKFCLENAKSKIITCHDFLRPNCKGVEKAVLEFVKKHSKSLRVIDTLAIIE